jgi:predicted nucleotidyltransferase
VHDNLPFTNKELVFLKELTRQKVEFIVIGLSAAALQGAPMVTQDVDLWFRDIDNSGIKKALKKVGGTWIPSLAPNPPMFEGDHVQYFDIVLTVHGIGDFDAEKANTVDVPLGGFSVKVLRLDRIIASKTCLNREKDRMVLPALKSAAKALIAKKPRGAKREKRRSTP